MKDTEILINVLRLMQFYFSETYTMYPEQVYHINFEGEDYDVYKEDAKTFAALRDKLNESEGLKQKINFLHDDRFN